MRLIDVDVAMNAFLDDCMDEYGKYFSCHDIDRVLDTVPKVDAAPVVHGRWAWDTEDIYKCTNCGEKSHVKEVMGKPDWNFCPNCGAKMDGMEELIDGTN